MIDERPVVVVVVCAIASVAWLAMFALAARFHAMVPALTAGGAIVVAGVLVWLPTVRARLMPSARSAAVDVGWGIAVGGVTVAGTYVGYPLLRAAWPDLAFDVQSIYRVMPSSGPALLVIVLVVVAEELLWRGALLEALRVDHPVLPAVVLSAALYAAATLGLGVPALAGAGLLLGSVWGLEAALTKRLIAPLISHAIWTLTVFAILPLEHP